MIKVLLSSKMGYNSAIMWGHRKLPEKADTFHGQHFLIDEKVAQDLIDQIPPGSTIIEIGAGRGQLTEKLAANAKRVVAIETDKKLLPDLRKAVKNKRVRVVNANALEVDFDHEGKRTVVTGAIPYHITEPLMHKLANSENVSEAVFIVGGRFADSIVNPQSTRRGPLAEAVSKVFNVRALRWIKKESFEPKPRTVSALIVMERKK